MFNNVQHALSYLLLRASVVLLVSSFSITSFAAAIIDNGTIQLGVDDYGQLNVAGGVPSPVTGTTYVGLRYLPTGNESTSHGCLCEGWGVGVSDTGTSGYANNALGTAGLTVDSFVSTATTATSVVDMNGELKVTHEFLPSVESSELYQVKVTIENTGADITNLYYRRTFDWDVEPTTFSEYVTIAGSAAATSVIDANDNGFCSSNPFVACDPLLASGDFVDSGPSDHGTNFDFNFGSLAAGESFSFDIYYGASMTEAGALAALADVGAEVYSLGQPSSDPLGTGLAGTNTFIFGFSGVGGVPVGTEIPEPSTIGIMSIALLGLYGVRRNREKKSNNI